MLYPSNYQSLHYMAVPGSDFRSVSPLNFMVSLSGIALLENFKGAANGDWYKDVLRMDAYPMRMEAVLTRVKALLPALPPDNANGDVANWRFVPLQWTVYASFSSVFNKNASLNAGYEVDDWKIVRTTAKTTTGLTVQTFEGIDVDLSVRDIDGQINKVGYEINMHGYFAAFWNARID